MLKPVTMRARSVWETVIVAFNRDLQQPQIQINDNLLTIFRYAIIVRFVISVMLWFFITSQVNEQSIGRVLAILDAFFLMIYLFATPLRSVFQDRYLPIALVWASIVPILNSTLTIYSFFTLPIPQVFQSQLGAVENFVIINNLGLTVPILLIPLLIVSWLYKRETVVLYLFGITTLDTILLLLFVPVDNRIFLALTLILFRLAILGFVGLIVNYLVTIQRNQAKALRDYASTRENLIASQERNRLARELHDTLAHSLAGITVQLEAVKVIWDTQPQRAKQLVGESAETVRIGLQETRRALQALRAETLESLGFIESIHELAKVTQARYGLDINVDVGGDFAWLTTEQEHVLYRIMQEALQNGVKHAEAQHLTINIYEHKDALRLTVIDDGIGYDMTHIDTNEHFGLQGMRERARLIGAQLTIRSQIGRGTTIQVDCERTPDEHTHL